VGLLVASVGVSIIAAPTGSSFAILIALEGAAVLIALRSISARAVFWPLLTGLVIVSLVVSLVPNESARTAATTLDVFVLLALPVIFVARFRRDLYVTVQSVFAAVSIYLVIGMVYAIVDATWSKLTGQSFFAQNADPTLSQYTYFSFITLCTVGYGDLTPATATARALAVSEGLLGQLYLVTVIALVVSNLGRRRASAGSTDG
jgi:hypothetical protein